MRAEHVAHALRRLRPGAYRVVDDPAGARVSLTMRASAAGRRNAATHVVALLGDHGLRLIADDPVDDLAEPGGDVRVAWLPDGSRSGRGAPAGPSAAAQSRPRGR